MDAYSAGFSPDRINLGKLWWLLGDEVKNDFHVVVVVVSETS